MEIRIQILMFVGVIVLLGLGIDLVFLRKEAPATDPFVKEGQGWYLASPTTQRRTLLQNYLAQNTTRDDVKSIDEELAFDVRVLLEKAYPPYWKEIIRFDVVLLGERRRLTLGFSRVGDTYIRNGSYWEDILTCSDVQLWYFFSGAACQTESLGLAKCPIRDYFFGPPQGEFPPSFLEEAKQETLCRRVYQATERLHPHFCKGAKDTKAIVDGIRRWTVACLSAEREL